MKVYVRTTKADAGRPANVVVSMQVVESDRTSGTHERCGEGSRDEAIPTQFTLTVQVFDDRMAVNSYITSVPKLKGRENYNEWAFAAENLLVLEGKLDCIKTESAKKLSGTGFNVNDEWIGCLMLAGLPDKYFHMIMAIEHSGIAITADVVKSKLIDMAGNDCDTNNALFTRGHHFSQIERNERNHKPSNSNKDGETSYVRNVNVVNNNKRKIIKCYRCKQVGHYKNQCTQEQNTKVKNTNAFSAVFLSGNFSKNDWYLDSGASIHMTNEVNNVRNRSNETSIKEIIAANRCAMPVLYSESVDIVTITPRNKYQVTINDVLCVPNLATNLISVSKLIQNGNSVNFTKNGGYIYNKKGELVAVAELIDGMYKVNTENRHCLFTSPSAVSSEVWHRRLGHLNSNDLNKMKDGAVTGMDYKDKAVIKKSTCVVCCEGKQSRLPFNHVGTRSTETLHTVHADLCGPMETTSIGRCRYYLILVDDYPRMAFVYFLKAKNQAFKYFKEFKSLVENQQNKKIKIFRTDNGLEFCSNEFEGYLTDAGIIHQKTNTYAPEQNAVSERMNRTIVERARCMLFDARLDKSFGLRQ
ncbi:Retrovirus-related Pol polyprotein from transposon TNT 1-94 [Eumeta japonica]|uniref:Retrovirus-related Pol polyprotein from transposon TNT 1-94 n=1 Tax=Eumeta variegata TaxID=151549 RepID=A0A4C1XW88_EUMVA|nr:Retrovirus-related Pol polyprotein from transposon TNT 1-94 [Eumeta japonica]